MSEYFSLSRVAEYFPQVLSCLHVTLSIVALATLFGLLLGALIAMARLARTPVVTQIVAVFISFVRGTPIIVQLFIVYFGLPVLLGRFGVNASRWDKFFFVTVTYSLNNAAFLSEIIRSAILSVDPGQREAALSVGLTGGQAFRRVIAPQALLTALPSFTTSVLSLLQNTSLALTIGIVDLIGKVRAIGVRTHHVLEGYVAAAVIFVLLSVILHQLFGLLERSLSRKLHKAEAL